MAFKNPTLLLCFLTLFGAHRAVGDANSATIETDVCIIGGGSSGTYSAIRLQAQGKNVTLIEKADRLGGHVNTYVDPATGISFDYGVVSFDNISVVTNYFDYLDVGLGPLNYNSGPAVYADFESGTIVNASSLPSGNLTAALLAYDAQLARYPDIYNGFDLPSPIPEDFLITWGDFIKKYELGALAFTVFTFLEGVGNVLAQPTLYIMKYLPSVTVTNILTGNFVTSANADNQELYNKALAKLGSSALLSSNVTKVSRSDDGVEVTVSTPTGQKLIKASKLLVAIQPKLENLSFLDLDAGEQGLFGQFNNSYYWDGVLNNTGIPDNTSINNVDLAAPYAIPTMPGIYGFGATGVDNLYTVYYSSPYALSDEDVQSDILATLARVSKAAGFPTNSTPEFVGFNNHSPFELTVSTDAIQNGFYQQLNALQGQWRTWWTGASWQAHDSSIIWNFTEYNILPKLLA
jgi:hypothetical protein